MSQRHLSGKAMVKWIEYLNCRTDYDELVKGMVGVPPIHEQGTLEAMQWFLKKGARGNRFRRDYPKLIDACIVGLTAIEELREEDDEN